MFKESAAKRPLARSLLRQSTIESKAALSLSSTVIWMAARGWLRRLQMPARTNMAASKGHTVVAVVEDDESMLRGIERLLGAFGFTTELYPSAEAYLSHANMSAANCLLLDIDLGGISGIELKRRLSASGSRVPVIFMTAIEDERTKKDALAAGCVACLQKPFAASALMQALDSIKS